MDGHRFDDLTRAVASGLDRRRLVKGLTAATLGGALTRLGVRDADAACPPEQVQTRRGCVCPTTGRPPDPATGYCPCPTGLTRCDGRCVDTRRDTAHCGGCDVTCPVGPHVDRVVCRSGVCTIAACATGAPCGDACCEPSATCVSGTCQPCTPIGFEPESACTESTVCCDGGRCVAFPSFIGEPSFCRPADCRLGGEPCDPITACCSWTCSGDTCQQ